MLYRYLIKLHRSNAFYNFRFGFLCGRVILYCKHPYPTLCFLRVGHKPASSEHHRALEIWCPVALLILFVAVNGKANLVASFNRINLMPRFCPMEIYLVFFNVIKIIYRHRKGMSSPFTAKMPCLSFCKSRFAASSDNTFFVLLIGLNITAPLIHRIVKSIFCPQQRSMRLFLHFVY